MANVVLIIHLLLALSLIGVVLLQRSDSGGLGAMGGGGSGVVSARSAATALGKLTWILAIAFICTSLALTVISARNAAGTSVIDRVGAAPTAPAEPADTTPSPIEGDSLLPPPSGSADGPLVPKAD